VPRILVYLIINSNFILEIFNADIVIREDITVDQFIDVILGNRRYINCIYVSLIAFWNIATAFD
jgi:ribosome-interacting GTPase 1